MSDKDLIEALCDIEEGLSDWEVDFVDSLEKSAGVDPKKKRTKALQRKSG